MIPKGAAIAMIARSRLSYAQGQESRKAKTLGLTNRSIHEDDRSMSGVDAVCGFGNIVSRQRTETDMKSASEIVVHQGQIISQLMEASQRRAKVDDRVKNVMDVISVVLHIAFFISVTMAIITRFC